MRLFNILLLALLLTACVPAKKYNDLYEKEQKCSEELKKYKTSSLESEAQLKTAHTKLNLLEREIDILKADTTQLGNAFRSLKAQFEKEKSLRSEERRVGKE